MLSGARFVKKWSKSITLKEEYEKDINFAFLNVDNQNGQLHSKIRRKWYSSSKSFDRKGNLISTFIGKQEELAIKKSFDQLKKNQNPKKNLLMMNFQ